MKRTSFSITAVAFLVIFITLVANTTSQTGLIQCYTGISCPPSDYYLAFSLTLRVSSSQFNQSFVLINSAITGYIQAAGSNFAYIDSMSETTNTTTIIGRIPTTPSNSQALLAQMNSIISASQISSYISSSSVNIVDNTSNSTNNSTSN
jgi:hypothetical protein